MGENLDILPYPIACFFRRIRASHAKDPKRLKHILQTVEMVARFFSIVVLSDLRDRVKNGQFPPPPTLKGYMEKLRRPSFGHWIEIMREGVRACKDLKQFFMPELEDFVFTRKGSLTSHFEALSNMVTLRNKFAHGDMSVADIKRACETGESALTDIFSAMSFLSSYKTYFVKCIRVKKRRLDLCRYIHEFWLLSGPYTEPEAVSDERKWHTDSDEVIIERPDGSYIDLDPLIIYLDDEKSSESAGIRPDLYIFNGYEDRKGLLSIRYLPGGVNSQEFESRDLPDMADQELLSKGLVEYLELFHS